MYRYALSIVILLLLAGMCSIGSAYAESIAGTLITLSSDAATLTIKEGSQTRKLTLSADTKVYRGQVGKTQQEVAPNELAPGDRILATAGADKKITSVRASYTIVAGTVEKVEGKKIVLKPGKPVFLHPNVQIALTSGKQGVVADIKVGAFVICRLEPLSKECWTVVVSQPQTVANVQPPETKPAEQENKPTVAKPQNLVIDSLVCRMKPNLKTGDYVTVEMRGTPAAIAKVEIVGLTGMVQLKEISPGVYQATIPLKTTDSVEGAVVSGYIKIGETMTDFVQAKEKISVNIPQTNQLPPPVEVPKVDLTPEPPVTPEPPAAEESPAEPEAPKPHSEPEPAAQPPAQPEPPQPEPIGPISLISPANLAHVDDTLTVTGTAHPGEQVLVQIEYTNGLSGILLMEGQVSSQLVGVSADGSFKYGPLPLTGIFNTKGLQYSIRVKYAEHPDKPMESRIVFGRR